MYLVDHKDDVALGLDFAQQSQNTGLELAAELGARHKGGEVNEVDLLILQLVGHVTLGHADGQRLGDGGLTHAGLTDEAGVVLLAAAEDLGDAGQLSFAAHDAVKLPSSRGLGEVAAVGGEVFQLLAALTAGLILTVVSLLVIAGGILGGGVVLAVLLQLTEQGGKALAKVLHALRHSFPVLTEEAGHINGGGAAVLHAVRFRGRGHHLVHAVLHGGDLLGGDAHLTRDAVQHIVDGQAYLLGASHAQSFGGSLSVFHFRNEYHSDALVASGAHNHIFHLLGFFPTGLLCLG